MTHYRKRNVVQDSTICLDERLEHVHLLSSEEEGRLLDVFWPLAASHHLTSQLSRSILGDTYHPPSELELRLLT